MADAITLDFLAAQQTQILGELRDMRTEMAAQRARLDTLTTAVLRLDQTAQGILTELHAIHVELSGFDRRIRRFEERVP